MGIINNINDLSNKVCVPNKTEDLNSNVFTVITGKWVINIKKHVWCECKCKFDGRKYNLSQKWNNDNVYDGAKKLKEHNAREKDYIWNHIAVKVLNI